jgi:ferredoxin
MYKKIRIHYFTGTGNSLAAVMLLGDALKKKGAAVQIINIENETGSRTGNADCEIIVSSVLGFSIPHIVSRYISRLEKRKGVDAAVIINGGGNPGRAVAQAEHALARRGFNVIRGDFLIYPSNWMQMSPTTKESVAKEMFAKAKKDISSIASGLMKGTKARFHVSIFNRILTTIVGWMFLNVGRQFLGQLFFADTKCNRCGICVKSCPASTIRFEKPFDGKPIWGIDCEDCNRCINICPKKAVQVSALALIAHVAYYYFTIEILLTYAGEVSTFMGIYTLPHVHFIKTGVVILGAVIIVMCNALVFTRLFFYLTRIPVLREIAAFSWTNFTGRYTAPGFKPLRR